MTAGGGGSIVCISSDAAKIPWPFLALYNTSKAGVEGMVRGAALELAHLNIRVNAVRPGLVKTNTTKDGLFANEAVISKFLAEKPLGRTGVPDDIAAGVRYLAGVGVRLGHRSEHRDRGRQRAHQGAVPRRPRAKAVRRGRHRRGARRSDPRMTTRALPLVRTPRWVSATRRSRR